MKALGVKGHVMDGAGELVRLQEEFGSIKELDRKEVRLNTGEA